MQLTHPYIITLDGDCFVRPDFIAKNRALAEAGYFVSGKRSYIRPLLTERILADPTASPWGWSASRWLGQAVRGRITRAAQLFPAPPWLDRYDKADSWSQVQGCNMGVWRSDYIGCGGYDEAWRGYGPDDTEFVLRLLRSGVRRKRGDYGSLVLHLYHARRRAPDGINNHERLREILASDRCWPVATRFSPPCPAHSHRERSSLPVAGEVP